MGKFWGHTPFDAPQRGRRPRTSARHLLACGVGAALACSAPVGAHAATWAVSQRAAVPAGAEIAGARIAIDPQGASLIDWVVADPPPATKARSGLLARTADGTFSAPTVLPLAIATAPVLLGDGTGLLLGGQVDGWKYSGLSWASVRSGTVGTWHRLTGATLALAPSLSANARGDAIAAWVERRGQGVRLRAALRTAGHEFRRPFTVFDDPTSRWDTDGLKLAVSTAIGTDGRVLLAYSGRPTDQDRSTLRVAAWTGSVRAGLGARRIVGPHEGYVKLGTAITTGHRAVVAWGSQSGGIEAGSPWKVRVASLAAGGRAFSPVQVLDPGRKRAFSPSPVIVLAGPARSVLIGWGTAEDLASAVRYAVNATDTRFARYQEIADSGTLTGLAERSDGAAIATWTTPGPLPTVPATSLTEPQNYNVGAAFRAERTAPLGTAEPVVTVANTSFVSHRQPPLGAAVFDPTTRQPVSAVIVAGTDGGSPTLELYRRQQ
jgi:hypothetical protein